MIPLTKASISKLPPSLDWNTITSSENLPRTKRAVSTLCQVYPDTYNCARISTPLNFAKLSNCDYD